LESERTTLNHRAIPPDNGYKTWDQIAAYFDGDGCLSVRKVAVGIPFTLGLTIDFIDQSRKQILMIESFLGSKGISTGRPYCHGGAWRLSVGGIRDVKTVLQRMLPHLCKKGVEVAAALDYLRGISTGNEFQATLQQQVREGNREKVGRIVDLPWTRKEGLRRATKFSTSLPRKRHKLSKSEEDSLVQQYLTLKIGQRKLAKANGLPHAVVRRVLAHHGLASERYTH